MRVGRHHTPRDDIAARAERREYRGHHPVATADRADFDLSSLAVEHADRAGRCLHGLAERQADRRWCVSQLRTRRWIGTDQLRVRPRGARPQHPTYGNQHECHGSSERSRPHGDAPISNQSLARPDRFPPPEISRTRLDRAGARDLPELAQPVIGSCRPGTRRLRPSRHTTAPAPA